MTVRSRSRGSRSRSGKAKRRKPVDPVRSLQAGATVSRPDPSSQHEVLAERIIRDRSAAFTGALHPWSAAEGEHGFKALYDVVRESLDLCDSLIGELELDPPIACTSGCIHCCYNQIAMCEPEALFMGFYLLETRGPEQIRQLEAKARSMVDALKGKHWQDIGMERHKHLCIFIENGNCSVYPARPLVCRGWNSVNVDMCIASNLTCDAMTLIETHPLPKLLADCVQTGMLRGARDLGLETGFLLMARAMWMLLDGGLENNLIARTDEWLQGKPFFASKREW